MSKSILFKLFIFVALWMLNVRKTLLPLRARVNQALANIDRQLKQRYDLIPTLVAIVKSYARHERGALAAVVQAREAAISARERGAQAAAEKRLASALRQLFARSEAYPDLKANSKFQQLKSELLEIEHRLARLRRIYQGAVSEYSAGRQPVSVALVAALLGFREHQFFDIGMEERRISNPAPPLKI